MQITSLSLLHFRNYQQLEQKFNSQINVFYGNNAQGKTNILEALYYNSFGFSFRSKTDEELKSFGTEAFAVELGYKDAQGDGKIRIKRTDKKEILLNGVKESQKELFGTVNLVLFSPEDLQLVKGEPSLRRKFFNIELAQINRYYYELLLQYNKALFQRNKLLKDSKGQLDLAQLLVWDEQLAQYAASIMVLRGSFLQELSQIVADIYSRLTQGKEELQLRYALKTSLEVVEYKQLTRTQEEWYSFYRQELAKRHQLDCLRTTTSIGPHRDDYILEVNGQKLRSFGSQGQQRTGALALKLAELEFIYKQKGEYPVLLLDDVMSELDNQRRAQLLSFINGKVQTFITVNDKSLVQTEVPCQYFHIQAGQVSEESYE